MPAITKDFHTTASATESTFTLYMFCFGISQLVYGPLSDLFGRKKIIIFAMIIYILSSITSALSISINMLLIARCFEGIGAGGINALARAVANDLFTGKFLTKALSYTSIAASLSVMLSPTFGGFIQEYSHWQTNFWILSIYTMLLLIATIFYFPNTVALTQKSTSYLYYFYSQYKKVLTNRNFLCFALGASIAFSVSSAYYTASPFIFQHRLYLTPSEYGMLFLFTSGCYILGSFFTSYFSMNEYKRFWLGVFILNIAILIMLSFSFLDIFNIYAIVMPMMLAMFSISLIFITGMTEAVKHFKSIAGTAAAMLGCLQICAASTTSGIMAHLPQETVLPLSLLLLCLSLVVAGIATFIKRHKE